LVGEENRGLEYMFTMMNAARFAVGLQGVAVSDRAYQKAVAYAKERVQSRPVDGSVKRAVPIIQHPDVRRMLSTMRALTEGSRALAYVAASHCDLAHHHPEEMMRDEHAAIHEYLVPIVKGWSTELSLEVTSLGVQVHGGMGFIEETGAAQYYRDARILPIYEGTTAIQANDLVGRKTARDGGSVAKKLLSDIAKTVEALAQHEGSAFKSMQIHLARGHDAMQSVVAYIVANAKLDPNAVYAGSVPYLILAGVVLGGWQLARAMLVAQQKRSSDPSFYDAKLATGQFYAEHVLTRAVSFESEILGARGDMGMFALSEDQF
jgi:3-(methylthio)propanoyl-CoA dehydrogenase